jgi:DNA-binding beta-propeller fold protein YncE
LLDLVVVDRQDFVDGVDGWAGRRPSERISLMRTRVAALAVLLVVISTVLTGCSGGRRAAAGAAPTASTAAARPPLVPCGEAAVVGPSIRLVQPRVLSLPGAPDGVATTPDGRTSFVAIQSGVPRIAVIDNGPFGERLLRTVVVAAYVSGMTVTPDGRYVLGAAGRGAVVLDVATAMSGAGRALLGSLAAPPRVAGAGPGAAEIAVSPDSHYVFLTLEGAGAVAVFNLDAAIRQGFGSKGFLGSIPVGAGALGITVSPDGRWLYEVSESAGGRSARDRGALNVIELKRAVSDPARSVIATAAAACAPVRVAVSAAGRTVWVTAKDGNALLGFSAIALRSAPAHALVSVTRVGEQPLGLAVADGGRVVLVADSNLSNLRRARSGVSVVITTSNGSPTLLGSIPTGKLADAISVSATSDVALVTNSDSKQLEALTLNRIP